MNIPFLTALTRRNFNLLIGANKLATLEDVNTAIQFVNATRPYTEYIYQVLVPNPAEPTIFSRFSAMHGDGCNTSCTCAGTASPVGGCACPADNLGYCHADKTFYTDMALTYNSVGNYTLRITLDPKYLKDYNVNSVIPFLSSPSDARTNIGVAKVSGTVPGTYIFTVTTYNNATSAYENGIINNIFINLKVVYGPQTRPYI